MSKTWKWILGILAVLVIVGVVVGAVFMWRNYAPMALGSRVTRMRQYAQPAPGTPAVQPRPARRWPPIIRNVRVLRTDLAGVTAVSFTAAAKACP